MASRAQTRRGVVRHGDRGSAVRALQRRLSDLGYEVSTDGRFGPETEKALKAFQRSRGAKVDGVVGKETLGKLTRATKAEENPADVGIDAITKVVGTGQRLPGTSATGRGLGDLKAEQAGGGKRPKTGPGAASKDAAGNPIATNKTGPIGSTTVEKPKAMTFEKGGAAAGPKSAQAADDKERQANDQGFEEAHPRGGTGTAEGGRFVKKGDTGTLVTNAQTALNQANKSGLEADGQFGPKTEQAVKDFQARRGLVVDGIVGIKTSGALRRMLRGGQARRARAQARTAA